MADPDAIVVGAGPAGLACAAMLGRKGLAALVVEKTDRVASSWRLHYDRLHLHTDRRHSGLPGLTMPGHYPTYPSRDEVVAYLERYAAHFGIRPRFDTAVTSLTHDGATWCAHTDRGTMRAPVAVVATGMAAVPVRPSWPGEDAFEGRIVHSSGYRNPTPYLGQRVLVVGFGNSGAEIALDLAEAGVAVALSIRGPVHVLPRDLLGLPIIAWAILYGRLPARLVDAINAPVLRLAVGRIEALGLRRAAGGPRRAVEETGRVPVFDIGTLGRIRDGSIAVHAGLDRLTPHGAVFRDGAQAPFGALILATGYRSDLRPLLQAVEGVLDGVGRPLATGRTTRAPGLYFCGHLTSPTGQLRAIRLEAERIATLARRHVTALNARRLRAAGDQMPRMPAS